MFGHTFYHRLVARYISAFGTLVNDINISRFDGDKNSIQTMKVPLTYAPQEKVLSRLRQDMELSAPALILPRMSFEIIGINYDPERKLTNSANIIKSMLSTPGTAKTLYNPIPYNIEIELTITAKFAEDGFQIVEQILPFFTPDFTITAKLIDESEELFDIPITLQSVRHENMYEGTYEDRQLLTWALNFIIKGWFFGPTIDKKVIKFGNINVYNGTEEGVSPKDATITVQPGMDSAGNPTTDINKTLPYEEIEISDDWATIVKVYGYE